MDFAVVATTVDAGQPNSFWDAYYASTRQGDNPLTDAPSTFIQFCSPHIRPGSKVIEYGCGNGRDARWFAGQGCTYIGLDASTAAVDRCQATVNGASPAKRRSFRTGDFADPELLAAKSGTADVVYSRFTLHSVTDEQETVAVANAFRLLKPGGRFMLEARSTRDPRCGVGECVARNAYIDTHYRRFLELEATIAKCEAAGFEVVVACEEVRAANFLTDKAVVVRIIAAKPGLIAHGPAGQRTAGNANGSDERGNGMSGTVTSGRENKTPSLGTRPA